MLHEQRSLASADFIRSTLGVTAINSRTLAITIAEAPAAEHADPSFAVIWTQSKLGMGMAGRPRR
jgi:hypothetical protein